MNRAPAAPFQGAEPIAAIIPVAARCALATG